MFYTKYRPQKFSEMEQPSDIADALVAQVKSGKVGHAYLFVGPRGTGKTTTARVLSKALNCSNLAKNGDPCGECESCLAIKNGAFTDLIEIDAASNRGIDDIRDLRDKVKLAPSMGKNKIYIIDEVHMLSNEAFNAFLKTLEEPPRNTVFILCTTELQKVPETIRSRCQVFRFKRASMSQIVSKLERIVKEEGAKVSDKDLRKIAQASLGGFRDAETLLQQIVEGEMDVDKFLSFGTREKLAEFCGFLGDCDGAAALGMIVQLQEEGVDIHVWVGEFIKYLRDLLFIASGVVSVTDDMPEDIKEISLTQAKKFEIAWLTDVISKFSECHRYIRSSFIPTLPVEIVIVEICGGVATVAEKQPPKPRPTPEPKKPEALAEPKPTPVKAKEPEVAPAKPGKEEPKLEVELIQIQDKWQAFIDALKTVNNSISALIKSATPVNIEGPWVVLEVAYPFHKERLESNKNRLIVEKELGKLHNCEFIRFKCIVNSTLPKRLKKGETGNLTDLNVAPANAGALLDVFDGGLPLVSA